MKKRRRTAIATVNIRVNDRIRSQTVRVIGEKGEQIGVLPIQQALERAEKAGLDLVEVAPSANPPVCRIIDFGKYLYEVEKKERSARKKQVVVHVKELRFRPKIGEHDYQTKLRSAIRFLERGDRVKVTMMFRGREAAHREGGIRVLERLLEDLNDYSEVEKNYTLDNQSIVNILAPRKKSSRKTVTKSVGLDQKTNTNASQENADEENSSLNDVGADGSGDEDVQE
ncbi:MAG: translation initiation factor IF-3 [Candidatus Omnitrophica bacterium]|nr:translation initiation factor IF-3 [Candidatus Omnitrophota bacterium]